jgi:hypothetical protein
MHYSLANSSVPIGVDDVNTAFQAKDMPNAI